MKTGLYGFGYWGKKIYNTLLAEGHQVSVVDPALNQEQSCFVTSEELLNDKEIKCCFIATPPETHYRIAYDCLSKGKHVFMEKPFCLQVVHAKSLVDLALKNKKIISADQIFLFDQGATFIKQLLARNAIGELVKVKINRTSVGFSIKNIQVTDDLAIHDLYLLPYLLNLQIDSVRCLKSSWLKGQCIEAKLQYQIDQKVEIYATYSWRGKRSRRSLIFLGRKGKIIWSREKDGDRLLLYGQEKELIQSMSIKNMPSPLEKMILNFFLQTHKEYSRKALLEKYQSYKEEISLLKSIRHSL